jgi:hypothetical protein
LGDKEPLSGVIDVACGVAMWEQFRNWLYLIVFKPYRFFNMRPFESNQIEAIRLFKISSNGIDPKDCPSEPSKGAITDHPYATAYQKQVVLHGTWNSSIVVASASTSAAQRPAPGSARGSVCSSLHCSIQYTATIDACACSIFNIVTLRI